MPDRNPKVRRRLAQGKLTLRLCDLRNLGPQSQRLLAAVGVHDVDTLRRRGALDTYLAVRRAGLTRTLNLLWALAGALEPWPEGRDWREVAASESRLPLLLAVEARLAARESTLAAGGAEPAKPRKPGRKPRREAAQETVTWVPGLPFEPKKNRR